MHSIKTTLAAALVSLASACAGTVPPIDSAVEAYEAVHGAVSDACRLRVEDAEVVYSDRTSVVIECGNEKAIACLAKFDSRSAVIWITEGQGDATLAHEYLHVIFRCERPSDVTGNHDHQDAAWGKLPL